MDPTACWRRVCDALRDGDIEEAIEALHDLDDWRERGGFWPAPPCPGPWMVDDAMHFLRAVVRTVESNHV
jgi:hypothetical protein